MCVCFLPKKTDTHPCSSRPIKFISHTHSNVLVVTYLANFCQYLSCVWSVSFLRKQPLILVAAVLSILSLTDRHIAMYVLVANQSNRKYHSELYLHKKNCTSEQSITTCIFCLELFCRHRVDVFSIPARCSFSKQDRSNFLPVNSIEFRFFVKKISIHWNIFASWKAIKVPNLMRSQLHSLVFLRKIKALSSNYSHNPGVKDFLGQNYSEYSGMKILFFLVQFIGFQFYFST